MTQNYNIAVYNKGPVFIRHNLQMPELQFNIHLSYFEKINFMKWVTTTMCNQWA